MSAPEATPADLFAQNLMVLRTRRGLSQQDLARALQDAGHAITQSHLSLIEQRKKSANVNEMVGLCYFFGVDFDQMFSEIKPCSGCGGSGIERA